MYTNLFDCCAVIKSRPMCGMAYHMTHISGEHASLWWETGTSQQGWLLVSSDGDSQQFFLPWEELPDVIEVLFQEGWTWK